MMSRSRNSTCEPALPSSIAATLPAWLDLPEPRGFRPKRKYRTVWISDIHLGTRGCNATMLDRVSLADPIKLEPPFPDVVDAVDTPPLAQPRPLARSKAG